MASLGTSRRQKRLAFLFASTVVAVIAAVFVFTALGERVLYFYSPSDVASRPISGGATVNLGGLVKAGSVQSFPRAETQFAITDSANSTQVTYTGVLPDLFREGQGVVATGSFRSDGVFAATRILAKHDERYMPPEVAEALKKNGVWREGEAAQH